MTTFRLLVAMDEKKILKKARNRVEAKKGFFIHFIVFILTIPLLFLINFITVPQFWWAFIALGGWTLGLTIHFLAVFVAGSARIKDWERRELEKERDRLLLNEMEKSEFDMSSPPSEYLDLKERVKLKRGYDDKEFV